MAVLPICSAQTTVPPGPDRCVPAVSPAAAPRRLFWTYLPGLYGPGGSGAGSEVAGPADAPSAQRRNVNAASEYAPSTDASQPRAEAAVLDSGLRWTSAVAGGLQTGKVAVNVHADKAWRLVVTPIRAPQTADGQALPPAMLTATSTGGDPRFSLTSASEFAADGLVVAGGDTATPIEGVQITVTYQLDVGYVLAGAYSFSHNYSTLLCP